MDFKQILKFKAHSSRFIVEHTHSYLTFKRAPPPTSAFTQATFPVCNSRSQPQTLLKDCLSFRANLEFSFLSEEIVKHSWFMRM